ncbi:MAG TPA: hypothetical protein VGQ57_14385, partial [Polyangiaceae bacterium]|nr:hypothetical protein [Polyangiaceae bacterium]
ERAGRVIGSGMGVVYSYVNVALTRVGGAIDVIRSALGRIGLADKSWLQFFDTPLGDEWVGMTKSASPPPFGP